MKRIKRISVTIPAGLPRRYDITVGEDLFDAAAAFIAKEFPKRRIAVVTDSHVNRYSARLLSALSAVGRGADVCVLQPGERTKKLATIERITDHFFARGYGRDSVFIALGGGVVGDMTAFAASIFTRGVPFVQMPTTIVSMVDSSVGGKTGVDTRYGKNLIGTFDQPQTVFASLDLLTTLPDDEYRFGFSEVIKHALIRDKALFALLEKNIDKIRARDMSFLADCIARNIEIKKSVVEKDEREGGLRQILNFGHTIGHAIERASNYRMNHGRAVGCGLVYESIISSDLGHLTQTDVTRIADLLRGLSIVTPARFDPRRIIPLTRADKKAVGGKARYVMLSSIGTVRSEKGVYSFPVDDAVASRALATRLA
ncbi:MAG: 3-dehydroquinate synthase [Spirochaetota bacterium]|mgnify:CR=1 FL=1